MKSIHSNEAPAAIGPYSQATRTGGFVFTSGQLGLVPETGMLAEGGIAAQTRQALTNLSKVLETAGLTMRHVVKTTVFLADMSDFAAMNEVYATFFAEPFPARSAVAVKSLPKGGLVEIECIACEAL
jgi:2-iminobutanoate/2-iminopropanoate deaminase